MPNAEVVNVFPQPKAGALAACAYNIMDDAVVVEDVKVDVGVDIGFTLIVCT